MKKQYAGWLPWTQPDITVQMTPENTALAELKAGLASLGISEQPEVIVDRTMGEAYRIDRKPGISLTITGGSAGVLYGAYACLQALICGNPMPAASAPRYPLRMINCWDNVDGTVERGYSGRSLFFEGNRFDYDPARMRTLARLLASAGLNVLCINNVNVRDPGQELLDTWLPELAELAAIFRSFGVRLMVCIDFSMPMRYGIPTADPLDEQVRQWWCDRADKVYAAVPDLAGFLVKADSEHRPGPFTYGRNHADGANMLAKALKPHGGELIWRCFVYNCLQDWRDHSIDRPKAAYDTYMPLDGCFDDNVILQIKNGPYDFQVREPVSPLLLGLKDTRIALEVQLAQEYTGQQIDLFTMPPMWQWLFAHMDADRICAAAAVSNLGRDDNYTGNPLAAVNLYAFGRYSWDPALEPIRVVEDWARLTYTLPKVQYGLLTGMLMDSADIYELYNAPLGLGWMVTPNSHYGPNPYGYEFQPWGTFSRADRNAVGIDRTAAGTGYVEQYPPALRDLYADPETCPDNLLLFFHRLPYDYVMRDGRTLIQRIYDDHFEGLRRAEELRETLRRIDLPSPDREEAERRMDMQVANAREWCDIINTFFHRLSGAADAHGRTIYD